MLTGTVYLIENLINGKKYVGITTLDPEERFKSHIKASKAKKLNLCLIHKAIKKYGKEQFLLTTLEQCFQHELGEREIYWISKMKTFVNDYPNLGYNMTLGGEHSIRGYHHTPETRTLIASAMSGEKNPFFGKKHKESSLMAMKAKLVGRHMSQETKEKISASSRGKQVSNVTIEKIAAKNRGKKRTPEQRKRISDAKKRAFEASGKVRKVYPKIGRGLPVYQLDKDKTVVSYFESQTVASKILSIPQPSISYGLKTGTLVYGWYWTYATDRRRKTPNRAHLRGKPQQDCLNLVPQELVMLVSGYSETEERANLT